VLLLECSLKRYSSSISNAQVRVCASGSAAPCMGGSRWAWRVHKLRAVLVCFDTMLALPRVLLLQELAALWACWLPYRCSACVSAAGACAHPARLHA
jgi:hypothetical protein